MKSLAVTQTLLITICAGISLMAGAAESDKPQDPEPDVAVESPDRGTQLAEWEKNEVELLKVLKEVVGAQAAAQKGNVATDWNVVEANVKLALFDQSVDTREANWPHSQFSWVYAVHKDLSRQERHRKRYFEGEHEMEVLKLLEERLREEVEAVKAPQGAEPEEVSKSDDDETRWKFRDKSGSRTTKPRYKGQEPVN